MIGKTVSHYKILSKLGEGGMGVVYKAEDTKLERLVALKFLPDHFNADEQMAKRFMQEAKTASAMDHRHICNIHDIAAADDGRMFIAMAYYDGETLKSKMEKGRLSVAEALDITLQFGEGLSKAHSKGIVHRDIKPANIMITADGVVKILDFGIAKMGDHKMTKTGSTMGTMDYVSPEQFSGKAVDHRTDIWSSGVVLYEMLTGEVPFKGEYDDALLYAIFNDDPQPLSAYSNDIPEALDAVVQKALQKNPDDRYQDMGEMCTAIRTQRGEDVSDITYPRAARAPRQSGKRRMMIYTLAAMVLLLAVIAYYFWPEPHSPIDSIAVLPLVNLSGDPDQDYFVNGMTEVLITQLSKIEALGVPSWSSSMRYKNSNKTPVEIARELNVGALVEGSFMRDGDRIRITAQLIDAKTDRYLWTADYERDLRDVLTLQKEVAKAIAGEVNIQLTPQDEARIGDAQVVDPEAYELYLRARHHLLRGGDRYSERALECLEASVAIDPDYAPAYAAMVLPHLNTARDNLLSVDEAELKARRAASKALQLDDQLAEAHVATGLVQEFFEWNWAGAEASFQRAIQLNPRSSDVHWEYGWLQYRLGRFEEALVEIEMYRSIEQDSLSYTPHLGFFVIHYANGQYDQAIESLLKILELDSTAAWVNVGLGFLYLAKGDYEQAVTFIEKYMSLVEPLDSRNQGYIGYIYSVAGHQEKALTLLGDLQARWQQGEKPNIALGIAHIHTGLGQKKEALTWLEQDIVMHPNLSDLKVAAEYDSLRDEPRFKALLKKMNFEVDE